MKINEKKILNIPLSMRNINNKEFDEEPKLLIKSKSYQNIIPKPYKLESITSFKISKDDEEILRKNEEKRKKKEERKRNFNEFIKRNYAILEKKKGFENRKNFLFEKNREMKTEQERIEGFNRLIDDANRRFEAKERAEQMLKDIKTKGNNKKYTSDEWKEIYKKRFIDYETNHKKKMIMEKEKKEKEIIEENKKIEKEIENKTVKIPVKKVNEIFDKLYNKGRKIYNSKKEFSQTESTKKNHSNNKSFIKENNNEINHTLKKNKSISRYRNIQPRYMKFFQNQSLEETLGKLKEERKEYENKNNSKNTTLNKEKEKEKEQSRISYSSNSSGLKIYQTNFIQCIRFKDFPNLIDTESNNNNSLKQNLNKK